MRRLDSYLALTLTYYEQRLIFAHFFMDRIIKLL